MAKYIDPLTNVYIKVMISIYDTGDDVIIGDKTTAGQISAILWARGKGFIELIGLKENGLNYEWTEKGHKTFKEKWALELAMDVFNKIGKKS